ncbi:MAG: ABC transporter ATP-binding protein [Anaeroplasmataceae bacterium]
MKGIKNIYSWAKKYLVHLIILLCLFYALQLLYSYIPLLIQYAIKAIGKTDTQVNLPKFILNILEKQNDALKVILILGALIILVQLIRSTMRYTSNYMQNYVSESIALDMKKTMYNHIADLPFSYHNNVDTGDLIQRCTSDIDMSSKFPSNQFLELFNIIVTVGIGAYQVFNINTTLMWVSLSLIPFTAISSVIYFKYINKEFSKIEVLEAQMTTVIQENVNNARVVRAFNNEKYEFDKMDSISAKFKEKCEKYDFKRALFWGYMDAIVALQYAITMFVSILLTKKGFIDGADVVACLLLLGMLVWPMRALGRIISQFGQTLVATNRLDEILNIKIEFNQYENLKPIICGDIEFKNVSFAFKDDNTSLLKNISFKINKGETVAIVGRTGSGKSTICNIITRLLDYDNGSVLIDGVELNKIDKKYLRKKIKMVLQDPFLFSKTIYENIVISDKNTSLSKVNEVSEISAIKDEIDRFSNGFDTIVGEKGTTLSGGQKQRLAIARMLIDESPVLIFDDSLSALDNKTDLAIRRALHNKDRKQTTIIITHRTTTAKEADKIIVISNGEVESIGTHDQLVSEGKLYSELWSIQGELEKEFIYLSEGVDSYE